LDSLEGDSDFKNEDRTTKLITQLGSTWRLVPSMKFDLKIPWKLCVLCYFLPIFWQISANRSIFLFSGRIPMMREKKIEIECFMQSEAPCHGAMPPRYSSRVARLRRYALFLLFRYRIGLMDFLLFCQMQSDAERCAECGADSERCVTVWLRFGTVRCEAERRGAVRCDAVRCSVTHGAARSGAECCSAVRAAAGTCISPSQGLLSSSE
jgi:hypothetical protein